tara:strand:+ start:7741 stop:7932 length:192 start_codon:yes stop_codon:yes gene_type:complete
MDWKNLPRVDKEIVTYLREKFQSPKYDPKMTNEDLARSLAIHHGREEAIVAIEQVISLQKKGS